MRQIKAVIFDVDGTLFDSMEIWENLGARYLDTLGVNAKPGLREVLEKMSTQQGVEYLIAQYGLEFNIQEAMDGVNALLHKYYSEETDLKEGTRACLELLYAEKIPMMAATSGERKNVEAAMERHDIRNFFQGILTCSELNTDKTKPEIYLEAAKKMQVRLKETLVVEDVSHALETAKAAGFLTAGIYDRYSHSQQEEIREIADYYLQTLSDLKKYIKGV